MIYSSYKIILLIIFFLFSISNSWASGETPHDPKSIIKELNKRYESVETYADLGVITNPYFTVAFETFYIKPTHFALKWNTTLKNKNSKSDESQCIQYRLISKGKEALVEKAKSCNGKYSKKESMSLKNALIKTTGVSYGLVKFIPSLLMDDVPGKKITSMPFKVLYDGEEMGSSQYLIIESEAIPGRSIKLFIDNKSNTIKRINDKYPDGTVNEIIFDKVSINKEIDPVVFLEK